MKMRDKKRGRKKLLYLMYNSLTNPQMERTSFVTNCDCPWQYEFMVFFSSSPLLLFTLTSEMTLVSKELFIFQS